jgi:hypothetical protein
MHSYSARAGVGLGGDVHAQISALNLQVSPGGMSSHGHGGATRMQAFSVTIERAAPVSGLSWTAGWSAHRVSGQTEQAGLLEAQYKTGAHALYSRAEFVQRVESEVRFVEAPDGSHLHESIPRRFNVGELAAGYALRLPVWRAIEPSVGARASMNTIPEYIQPRYLAERGFAFAIFTSIRTARAHAH